MSSKINQNQSRIDRDDTISAGPLKLLIHMFKSEKKRLNTLNTDNRKNFKDPNWTSEDENYSVWKERKKKIMGEQFEDYRRKDILNVYRYLNKKYSKWERNKTKTKTKQRVSVSCGTISWGPICMYL